MLGYFLFKKIKKSSPLQTRFFHRNSVKFSLKFEALSRILTVYDETKEMILKSFIFLFSARLRLWRWLPTSD